MYRRREKKSAESGTAPDSWLYAYRPMPQSRLRLFCFPYAGGGTALFRSWPDFLPAQIEVCPVQLPGRESRFRETPFTSLTALLEPLTQALLPYLDKPYAFFGHSMGALLSFELARALRRKYRSSPVHLFVSGFRAPQLPDTHPALHDLPRKEFIQELGRLQGTPEEVLNNADLLELIIPLLRADFSVCETYVYHSEEPLLCPISAFGGLEDHEVAPESLSAWQKQTYLTFKTHFLPGNHFFIQTAQQQLLTLLAEDALSDKV